MRLAIVISRYRRGGGLERVAVEYARGLHARGHDVTVLASDLDPEDADRGITFVRVPAPRSMALRAIVFPRAASRAVAAATYDNVIAFGSVVTTPAVVRAPGCHRSWFEFANREWPVTTAAGLRRRLNPHHRIVLAWDRYILGGGRARAVSVAGEWQAQDVRRFYPAVADRVEILPDGVNLDEFRFDRAARDRVRVDWGVGDAPVLLAVVTEIRRKGVAGLIDSFAALRALEPRVRLVVATTLAPDAVLALARDRGVADAVGPVEFVREMRDAYCGADLMFFPTTFDTWGLPVAEALACGTPALVTARAGVAPHVRDGETGAVIADPRDARAVAAAAHAALERPVDRAAIAASVAHLSWDRVVGALEATLERTR